MILSIIVVIIMLGVLVTVHELGHFLVARLLKIKAFEVSIFVGPILASWKRKEVEYSVRAIPLGAYVRFTEIDEEGAPITSDDPQLLINQPRWKRFLVAIAGPVMNIILGVLLFTTLYSVTGFSSIRIDKTYADSQLGAVEYNIGDYIYKINGHRVWNYIDVFYELDMGAGEDEDVVLTLKNKESHELYDVTLVPTLQTRVMLGVTHYGDTNNKYHGWQIASVMPEQNNNHPILKVGDYLTYVDGISVDELLDSGYLDNKAEGDKITLTYIRNGKEYQDECAITLMTYANNRGIYTKYCKVESFGDFIEAFKSAAAMPISVSNVSIRSIASVFKGREKVYNMVSGPVGVTTAVSDVVQNVDHSIADKLINLLNLSAIISIALSFSNLLPIPGLDGIQIILLFIEMILGRPISDKAEGIINVIGFILIVLLVIFALTSDVIRIFVGGL